MTFFFATDWRRICIKQARLHWYDQGQVRISFASTIRNLCACVCVCVFASMCVCVCVCVRGQKFNVHTLSCKKGGFITIWHNQVTGTTTNLLKIICTDVKTETPLLPLSGESLSERTGNIQYSACADLRAICFWIAK